jgi:hypothetical protein
MSYDFFVSYSRALYQSDARNVTSILESCGFSVWLDERQIPSDLAGEELIRSLSHAVQACNYVVFFDLQGWLKKIAIGILAGGGGAVPLPVDQLSSFSTPWQKFERQFANKLIDINPPTKTIRFGGPSNNRELPNEYPETKYEDYPDAVDKILSKLGLK